MGYCSIHGKYTDGTIVGCSACRMINAAPQIYPEVIAATTTTFLESTKPCIMCTLPATVTAGYCANHWDERVSLRQRVSQLEGHLRNLLNDASLSAWAQSVIRGALGSSPSPREESK